MIQTIRVATGWILTVQRLEIEQSWLLFFNVFIISFLPIALLLRYRFFLRVIWVGLGVVAIVAILNYVGLAGSYPTFIDYADPAEANVASVSWIFQTGKPLYPSLEAAERYINNYGPFLYIIHGFFLSVLKPSFLSSKLAGSLAGIGSLLLMFLMLKRQLGFRFAVVGSAIVSLCLLALTSASGLLTSSFWVRPDSLLLFCTTLGLFAVVQGNRAIAVWVNAIALGISTNLKVTAVLHFLPIYVLLVFRFGVLNTLISIIGAVIVAALPFVAYSQISLENYITWLRQVREKGINNEQITKNLLWMAYVSLPIVIGSMQLAFTNFSSFKQWIYKHRLYLLALGIGIAIAAVLGATRGALENNMMPFVPLVAYLCGDLFEQIIISSNDKRRTAITALSFSVALSFIVSIGLTVHSIEAGYISRMTTATGAAAVQDIDRFLSAHRKTSIGMGYGSSYPLSTYRPALVFAGNPYLLDSASLMEMQASGLENTPAQTLKAIQTCQTQIWLIPKNQKPFEVYNYYPPLQKLFSAEFRQNFLKHYEPREQTEYYDAWRCKK